MNDKRTFELPVVPLYYSVPLLFICISAFLILFFLFRIEIPVLLLQPVPPGAINVSACGVVLSQNNAYYVLNASLNFSSSPCIVISGDNITLNGQSQYWISGINTNSVQAVIVDGRNATVTKLNVTSAFYGIDVRMGNATIISNFINGSNEAVRLESAPAPNTKITQNTIVNSVLGIWLKNSNYCVVGQNVISGLGNSGVGIKVYGSSYNNVTDNKVNNTYQSIEVDVSSNENIFSNNFLDRAFTNGLVVSNSVNNLFLSNRISNSLGSAVLIYLSNGQFVSLKNNSVTNTNVSFYDLEIASSLSSGLGYTELTDNSFSSYKINSTVVFANSGNSKINFTQPLDVSGANLGNDVSLGFNYAGVNSNLRPGLNKSAIIIFEGIPTNLINMTIYRDGAPCPLNICRNITSLNAGTVVFNVTGWTNYSISFLGSVTSGNLTINEPDNNGQYTQSSFPVVFDVLLNKNGTVKFSLDNGTTNTSMITTNNLSFTYSQGVLPIKNYTFIVYANFSNGQKQTSSINFSVVDIIPVMQINEPDSNEVYYLSAFPVTFDVSLNLNGTVKFSLDSGVTNTTMSTSDNRSFSYRQTSLSVGSYNFTAYANFSNGARQTASVSFRVTNNPSGSSGSGSGSGSGGSSGGTSGNKSGGNSSTGGSSSGGSYVGGSGGSTGGGFDVGTRFSTLKNVGYWTVIVIVSVLIIILILLIVKYLRARVAEKSSPQIYSHLR